MPTERRVTMSNNIPLRLQRSRAQKQPAPANGLPVKYVGRPGVWGNPFKVVGDMIYINAAHRRTIAQPWVYLCMGGLEDCLRFFRAVATGVMDSKDFALLDGSIDDILFWLEQFSQLDLDELRNKNLSCWCKQGVPCHADVLLEIANEPEILLKSQIVKLNNTNEYFQVAFGPYNNIEEISYTKAREDATLFQEDAHVIKTRTGHVIRIGSTRRTEFVFFLANRGIKIDDLTVEEVWAPEQPILNKDQQKQISKVINLLKKFYKK